MKNVDQKDPETGLDSLDQSALDGEDERTATTSKFTLGRHVMFGALKVVARRHNWRHDRRYNHVKKQNVGQ